LLSNEAYTFEAALEALFMKKQQRFLLLVTSAMLLASCGPSAATSANSLTSDSKSEAENSASSSAVSASSTTSSVSGDSVTFSAALTLLTNMAEQETALSNKVHVVQTNTKENTIDASDEIFTLKKDGSSFSTGSLTRKENGTETLSDTFIRRYVEQIDKIQDSSGAVADYPMFYQITDHAKDVFAADDYQDSATKTFVVENAADAATLGLGTGDYLLTSDVAAASSAQAIAHLVNFIDSSIVNNDYVTQLGLKTFSREGRRYSFTAAYSYDGDLDDTQTFIVNASFTFDSQDLYLEKVAYSLTNKDQSKSDSTDVYTTTSSYEATLNYGTRSDETAPLEVNDYFLANISSIDICNSDSNRSKADPKAFSLENSYLFAKAAAYSPTKATNLGLTNAATSDSAVIALTDDGYFEVKAAGKVSLTFTYFGRLDSGVYEERSLTSDIVVVEPKATDLTLFSITPSIVDDTLYIGTSYKISTSISPAKASQAISVTSSDETVLKAAAGSNDEDVVLTPLSAGNATITVTSLANPSLKKTMSLTTKEAVAADRYLNRLTSTTYLYTNTNYGYTLAITFKADGTGRRLQTLTSSGKTFTDTFAYTLKGTALTFSDWSDDAIHPYQSGLIAKDGSELILEDNESAMVSDTYEAQQA
jgi:hypothetical protein